MTDVFKSYRIEPSGPTTITMPCSPDPTCLFTFTAAKSEPLMVVADGQRIGRLSPGQSMVVGWRKGAYRRIWDGRVETTRRRRLRAIVRPKRQA